MKNSVESLLESDHESLGPLLIELRDSKARQRVLEMRAVFRRNRNQLGAVSITGVKR